jgi:predicted DNA-binding transcriptional regulator YafY
LAVIFRPRWLEDGSYELSIPYRESRELVMDVMRHGPGVEVIAPPDLREKIGAELRLAANRYDEHLAGRSMHKVS